VIERRRGARSSRSIPPVRAARCRRFLRARAVDHGRVRWLLDEGGSASLLVGMWSMVLTMLAAGAIALTSALAAREAVSAAADLAALAGASATLTEPDRACPRAISIASENGATLTECRVAGTEVWVVAQAPAPPALQWLVPAGRAHVRARAHAQLTAEEP
jgi:secretion/DNA translocation related TadE-like protein